MFRSAVSLSNPIFPMPFSEAFETLPSADRAVPNGVVLADLARLYERMVLIRLFEEMLLTLFSRGKLRGTVHTCLGQEACAVGIVDALDPARDTVSSNHRGHGHFLAFNPDTRGLLAEVIGLEQGICGGKGGSQHLHSKNFYSNGILGGMAPVTAGMALAQKFSGQGGISVLFSGDGAMAEGVVYEALNMASLWKLPLLLIVEHNKYAQSTHWSLEHGSPIEGRPAAFGVPTDVVDGNDVRIVRAAAGRIVADMRREPGPRCIVLDTYRLGPHSKGDDNRSKQEIAKQRMRDPLALVETILEPADTAQIQARCARHIEELMDEFA
ncbi:AcoA Pyruvate/2-oxoglutarate dehydrogenase complex, dehydrogenase (E1) component, eukaryotic type, alpha subunit [Rhabdaerophilaceae bacterium]